MPTYKQLVDLSKPVSYWRLGEGTLDMTQQTMATVLDGTNTDWGNTDLNQSVITINGTGANWSYTHGSTGYDNDLADCRYYYTGDFDISFDYSNATWTNLNAAGSYIGLLISVHVNNADLFNVQIQQTNTGTRTFYCNAPGVTDTHTAVNDFGSLRIARVGSTITAYVKDGVEAWDQRMTYVSSDTCTPYFYIQGSGDVDANLSVDVDNLSATGVAQAYVVLNDGSEDIRLFNQKGPSTDAASLIAGGVNSAFTYDGVDQYSLRNIADFRSTDSQGAIEFWVQDNANAESHVIFGASTALDTINRFIIYVYSVTGAIGIEHNTAGTLTSVRASTNIQDGKAHHVVINSDGSSYKVWVDGKDEGALSVVTGSNNGNWFADIAAGTDTVTLGAQSISIVQNFVNGTLDEVAVYDRPLSSAEIYKRYEIGLSNEQYVQKIIADGASNYWRLGEASGPTAYNEIGSYHLTHQNTTVGVTGLLGVSDDLAVNFNGTTSYLREDLDDSVKTASATVEAWFKTSKTDNVQNMFIAGGVPSRSGADGRGFYITLTTDGYLRVNMGKISVASFAFAVGTTDLRDGAVHHAVGTYDGTWIRLYVDGEEVASTNDAAGIEWTDGSGDPTPGQFYIGASRDNTPTGPEPNRDYFDGEIDEVAFYPTALTASQVRSHFINGFYSNEPYSTTVLKDEPVNYWRMDVAGNINATNPILMMPMEGDTDTTLFEETYAARTVTVHGNARIRPELKAFGRSSAYFDGTGDYLSLAHTTDWELNAIDFTIDAWVYLTSYADWRTIVAHHSGTAGWRLMVGVNGQLHLSTNDGAGNGFFGSTSVPVPLNQWVHVAAVGFADGQTKGYVNGKLCGKSTGTYVNTVNTTLKIGSTNGSAWFWVGYIDELRILKGTALYTDDFDPPTRPFTNRTLQNRHFNGGLLTGWSIRGGTVNASGNQLNIARAGAGYDSHGAYQTFATVPGQSYRLEGWVTAASHYTEIRVSPDTSFTRFLGSANFSSNGQTGVLTARFTAEGDTCSVLCRVANSATATASFDAFNLWTAITDETDNLDVDLQGDPASGQKSIIPTDPNTTSVLLNGSTQKGYRSTADYRSADTSGSIEAWFATSSPTGENCIFSSSDEASNSYFCYLACTDGKIRIRFRDNVTDYDFVTTANSFNDGEAHHVVATSNGSTIKVYVDGIERSLTITAGTNIGKWFEFTPQRDNITIGALTYSSGTFVYFDGLLQDIAVYNYALSPAQIKEHYYAGIFDNYSKFIRATGPVNYWRLGETIGETIAKDSIGELSLTYTNSPGLQSDSLIATSEDYAVQFDGINQYAIAAESNYRFSDSQGTVEAWVKSSGTGFQTVFGTSDEDGGLDNFQILIRDTGTVQVYVRIDGGATNSLISTTTVNDGALHHIVAVSSGTEYRLYIDGIFEPLSVASGANDGKWLNNFADTDNVTIGCSHPASPIQFFDGVIDEVAYYNRALTTVEVYEHYIEGSTATVNVSGNATTYAGDPVDTVCFFLWKDKRYNFSFKPDSNGDWEGTLNAGEYGVTYLAEGCKPITHGPYTVN